MNIKYIFYIMALPLLVSACNQETKFELAERKLGIEIKHSTDFDYENLEHLTFLYYHASEDDKEFARLSLESAYKTMREKPLDFPMEDYRDAIVSYPTPYVVLGFANGFLKTAKRMLRISHGILDKEKPESKNDHSTLWYYKGSIFYFELALEFSRIVDKSFDKKLVTEIESRIRCINNKINDYSSENSGVECEEVYDPLFHEFLDSSPPQHSVVTM